MEASIAGPKDYCGKLALPSRSKQPRGQDTRQNSDPLQGSRCTKSEHKVTQNSVLKETGYPFNRHPSCSHRKTAYTLFDLD